MHQRLFVEFSCDHYLTSALRFIACVVIGLLTSGCHNTNCHNTNWAYSRGRVVLQRTQGKDGNWYDRRLEVEYDIRDTTASCYGTLWT